MNPIQKDLVVLVADKNMEDTITTLLTERTPSLGIREILFDVFRHPQRDPGVFHKAEQFLRPFVTQYHRALVMLDREGSGQEHLTPEEIRNQIQRRLDQVGWQGRSAVFVLDPELEIWAFADSPHVIEVFANGDSRLFQEVLTSFNKVYPTGSKPKRPKEVIETLLKRTRTPRSSSLYSQLARKVGLARCQDPTFREFKRTLQLWFPRRAS